MLHFVNRLLPALLLMVVLPIQAQVNVYPDRFTVSEGETLQLTVEVDQRASQRPDFSPLTKDFHFLGSKQMTVSSHANGDNQYSTRWKILLRPRRAGDLTIPALQLNNQRSQPVLITVNGDTGTAALVSRDAYIESAVDGNEVYQNSQLLYSQRLFHINELPAMAVQSEPEIDGVEIIPLGEPLNYNRTINGQNYQVIEKNYALFPERPGQLEIPPAYFSAGPGTAELSSEPIQIDILPRVAQKIRGYWLPARSLTLEDLTETDANLALGESLIRTVRITAEGLTAEQLPALVSLRNELADISVEDIRLEQSNSATGLISSRTEVIKITPKERGEVTLQAIAIPWWNTVKDKNKTAQLGVVTLRVTPAPETNSEAPIVPQPSTSTSQDSPEVTAASDSSLNLLIWILAAIAAITSMGWLYSFASLRHKRSTTDKLPDAAASYSATQLTPDTEISELPVPDTEKLTQLLQQEQDSFSLALEACNNDLPLEARLLILEWARLFWPHNQFNSSLDLSDLTNSQTLELLLIDMEDYISGAETGEWSGDLLAQALIHIRENQLQQTEEA